MARNKDSRLSQSPPDPERHFGRGAWLTLLFGLGLIAFHLVMLIWGFSLPTDGWWTQEIRHSSGDRTVRFVLNLSGQPSPLREGDILLAVDGQGPETFIRTYGPLLQAGRTPIFTVERDGEAVEFPISLTPRQLDGILLVNAYRWRQNPLAVAMPLAFFLLGAFVFAMRPGNSSARYLFLIGSFLLLTFVTFSDAPAVRTHLPMTYMGMAPFLGGTWAYLFFPWLLLLVLEFPTPIGPARRWPRTFRALIFGIPLAVTIAALIPYWRSRNPADLGSLSDIQGILVVIVMSVLVLTLGATLIYRLRVTETPLERAQLHWFALGMTLGIGGMATLTSAAILLDQRDLINGDVTSELVGSIGLSIAIVMPLCLVVAILRYRLFDIAIVIRKTLQYTLVSGILLLIYVGTVILLQGVFTRVSGQSSTAVVVLSTLLIAALFNPIRRWSQNAIDRRFFRRRYDQEQVLARFAATARDVTDLDDLTSELLNVIQETMQPESLSLWLKPSSADVKPLRAE